MGRLHRPRRAGRDKTQEQLGGLVPQVREFGHVPKAPIPSLKFGVRRWRDSDSANFHGSIKRSGARHSHSGRKRSASSRPCRNPFLAAGGRRRASIKLNPNARLLSESGVISATRLPLARSVSSSFSKRR